MSAMTQYYLELEEKYGAHNYHPIPVVLESWRRSFCLGCGRQTLL